MAEGSGRPGTPPKGRAVAAPPRGLTSPEVVMIPHVVRAITAEERRRSFLLLSGSLLTNVVLAIGVVVALNYHPAPLEFAVKPDMSMVQIHPMNEAAISDAMVQQWATNAINQCFSFDFVHINKQLEDCAPMFTDAGFQGFKVALDRNKLRQQIIDQKYVSSAVVTETPQIIRKSEMNGARAWVLRAPVTLTFDTGTNRIPQRMSIDLFAVRVPETKNQYGIAIQNVVAAHS